MTHHTHLAHILPEASGTCRVLGLPIPHKIARPDTYGSLYTDPLNPRFDVVGGLAASTVGMELHAVGKNNGLQGGWVQDTCRDVTTGDLRVILCQDVMGLLGLGQGDSGAPIFKAEDWDTSEVLMAGIYRGRAGGFPIRYLFTPMSQIYLAYPYLYILPE